MKRNLLYACGAQIVSFSLSILLSLLLPKYLGLEDYAYWQLFIFYASYVGLFHFGLTDGIYLRMGGLEYDRLNFSEIKTQMTVMVLVQLVLGCVVGIAAQLFVSAGQRKEIIYFTIFYTVVGNISWFLGYLFQAVNRIDKYATAVMLNKAIVIAAFLALILLHKTTCLTYVKWYCIGQTIMCLYSLLNAKEILSAGWCALGRLWEELKANVSCGVILTVSNISGNLIIGAARQIIDVRWGLVTFGKISLAFSLTMFFQQFINQIGNVFFPVLRRKRQSNVQAFYRSMAILFTTILPVIFILYLPMAYVLGKWLPQYADSLKYMSVLLPVCVFDGKMSVLCTTALKVFRQEKKMLAVNVASMAFAVICGLAVTYVWNNLWITMSVTVITIIAREIYTENYVRKLLDIDIGRWQAHCCILTALMEITIMFELPYNMKFILCVLQYVFFLLIHRDEIKVAGHSLL